MSAEPDRAAYGPPSPLLTALESRAWLELVSLLPALPVLDRAPAGDGHPVLVLPGWLAGDVSTRTLRWFLRRRGYHVHGWRLGRNVGATEEIVHGLGSRFHALRRRHDRPISIVGWSLGGIYARELARRFPDDVRQVITLGWETHPRRADPRAGDVDLQPQRRRRRVAELPRYPGAAARERRGVVEPLRAGAPPRRAPRHRRPPGATRRHLAALRLAELAPLAALRGAIGLTSCRLTRPVTCRSDSGYSRRTAGRRSA
jgi:pimeloyl-ACP methyl ester carboxylesterase